MNERDRRVVDVLLQLEPGEVTTYGDVAADAGYPRHARCVGQLLASGAADVPWWRVVNAQGRLVPGNEREHAALLRSEGVTIVKDRAVAAPLGRFASSVQRRTGS